jgi:hypothetical protein
MSTAAVIGDDAEALAVAAELAAGFRKDAAERDAARRLPRAGPDRPAARRDRARPSRPGRARVSEWGRRASPPHGDQRLPPCPLPIPEGRPCLPLLGGEVPPVRKEIEAQGRT